MQVQIPRHGTLGNPSKAHVWTNSFAFPLPLNSKIIHYHEFKPNWTQKTEVKFGPARRRDIMVRLQQEKTFNPVGAFDGKHNLYSAVKPLFSSNSQSFYIAFDKDDPRRRQVEVKIVCVGELDLSILRNLRSTNPDQLSYAINMLNVFVQAQPKKDHLYNSTSVFKKNLDTMDRRSIAPLELWRGVFQSVRPTFDRIVVNVDTTVGVVVPDQELERLCYEYLRLRRGEVLSSISSDQFQVLRHFLRGIKVRVMHRGRSEARTIKIRDLVYDVGAESFQKIVQQGDRERSVQITVAEHFYSTYNITIPRGSLGIRGSHEMFPMIFCRTIQQLYQNKVTPDMAAKVLRFGVKNPQQKLSDIKNEWSALEHGHSEYLRGAGIALSGSDHPQHVNGRILDPPKIRYGRNQIEDLGVRPGSWNMVGKALAEPVTLNSWVIVDFTLHEQHTLLAQFVAGLTREMGSFGVSTPQMVEANPCSADQALANACRDYNPGLIVAILREFDADLYTKVKRFGDVVQGVPTQCIKWTDKLWKQNPNRMSQYHANVILKINARLGGVNFVPDDSDIAMKHLKAERTMILGADVSHPSPQSTLPSMAGLAFSFDQCATKYGAEVRLQRSRLEVIEKLEEMVSQALYVFWKKRAKLPKVIYYFRDGVSEGQFKHVFDHENTAIERACTAAETGARLHDAKSKALPPYRPKIVFVVCGKRHHVRFIPRDEPSKDRQGNNNCFPGLVVDSASGFSHPHHVDFYLQSQQGLQGTSRPTHYTILSKIRPPMDLMQGLTYTLCHNYERATKSVKIPAPLVCRRAKFHYDESVDYSDDLSVDSDSPDFASKQLEFYQAHFRPIHHNLRYSMYFV
ncbi:protein argonaute-2 [Favolaschia claudopus]|uniref:Protein argonaute-2 n=1 Tax=Favolaschia claudopus TaxID=2862362 RepID=A0AAW0BDL3_9AGAR